MAFLAFVVARADAAVAAATVVAVLAAADNNRRERARARRTICIIRFASIDLDLWIALDQRALRP